jgi:hypothetical protein
VEEAGIKYSYENGKNGFKIVITNYFLQLCGHELVFATIDGKPVTAQE